VDLATFAVEALADIRTVGAVAPSSRYLTRAMVDPLHLRNAQVVVEMGCGTGALTQLMLSQMPSKSVLLAFEINARFSCYLRKRIRDPRLVVINASAETMKDEVVRRGFERVDAVASSLALTLMSDQLRNAILSESAALLHPSGVFTQYHYLHGMQWQEGRLGRFPGAKLLLQHFRSVERTIVWRNLPPAYVFVCRKPQPARLDDAARLGSVA
jgi:phospholipid N-methyltransferase